MTYGVRGQAQGSAVPLSTHIIIGAAWEANQPDGPCRGNLAFTLIAPQLTSHSHIITLLSPAVAFALAPPFPVLSLPLSLLIVYFLLSVRGAVRYGRQDVAANGQTCRPCEVRSLGAYGSASTCWMQRCFGFMLTSL